MNEAFVVDASVGIKLFVEEEFSEKVQALFDLLAKNPPTKLFVPDLFYVECANTRGAWGDPSAIRIRICRI